MLCSRGNPDLIFIETRYGDSPARRCGVTLASTTDSLYWSSLVVCSLPPSPPVMCQAEQAVGHLLNKAWTSGSTCEDKAQTSFSQLSLPLVHLLGASFGFPAHMLTRSWPPVPHTKAREASLAVIQRGHRSQTLCAQRHWVDFTTHFSVI